MILNNCIELNKEIFVLYTSVYLHSEYRISILVPNYATGAQAYRDQPEYQMDIIFDSPPWENQLAQRKYHLVETWANQCMVSRTTIHLISRVIVTYPRCLIRAYMPLGNACQVYGDPHPCDDRLLGLWAFWPKPTVDGIVIATEHPSVHDMHFFITRSGWTLEVLSSPASQIPRSISKLPEVKHLTLLTVRKSPCQRGLSYCD